MRHTYSLDHFALLVRDVGRSVSFYRDVMGFSPIERTGSPNVEWLDIGGGDAIHLIQGEFGATHVTKDTHVAVSIADFDALVAELNAGGIPFTDWPGNPGRIGVHRNGFRPFPIPGAGPASLPRLAVYPRRNDQEYGMGFGGGDIVLVVGSPSPTKLNTEFFG